MKKIFLNFKEYKLGFLTQKENIFVWVPDTEAIVSCFNRYDGAFDMFMLGSKESEVYKQIPIHYQDFLMATERSDLQKAAGINQKDNSFERLCKMAKLKYFNQDFYISI